MLMHILSFYLTFPVPHFFPLVFTPFTESTIKPQVTQASCFSLSETVYENLAQRINLRKRKIPIDNYLRSFQYICKGCTNRNCNIALVQGLPSSQEAIMVKHPHTPPSTTCVVSLRLKVPVNYTISQWSFHIVLFFYFSKSSSFIYSFNFCGWNPEWSRETFQIKKILRL